MVGSQGSASAPGERVLFGDVFPRHVTQGPWLVPFGQFRLGQLRSVGNGTSRPHSGSSGQPAHGSEVSCRKPAHRT